MIVSSRRIQVISTLPLFLLLVLLTGCQQVKTFEYQIQVESAGTGAPISAANVRAEMGTRDFVVTETDANGIAHLVIDQYYLDRWAKVIVEAEDYPRQSFLVDLLEDEPVTVLKLEKSSTETSAEQKSDKAVATDSSQNAPVEVEEPTVETDRSQPPPPGELANLDPAQRANYFQAKPELTIETGKTYRATIQTSKGDIVVSLDAAAAPEHVNNFIFLSNQGFYDGLTFHRVEPGFVIQGGDPEGTGQGGPGYTIPGEFSLKHIEGALAMARLPDSINPERESSGSQFYITLAPTPFLDDQYSVFGKVEEGMDVVRSIEVGDVIERIIVEP